jgi:outer membrane protein assembly factor BamD
MVLLLVGGLVGCWPFKGRSGPVPASVLATSPRTIDSLWLVGQQAFSRGEWGDARRAFTRVAAALAPTDPRHTRLLFFQGELELAQGNDLDAVRLFRRIADENPEDSLAPDALVRAGDAYARLWRRPELDPTYGTTALSVYGEVGSRYPGTRAARQAEAGIVRLNEMFAEKEYRSALFYYRFKAYDSAILTLRALIAEYPRAAVVPEALEKLVLAYRQLGYEEDVRDTCQYIAQFHPDPAGPRRLCMTDDGPGSG